MIVINFEMYLLNLDILSNYPQRHFTTTCQQHLATHFQYTQHALLKYKDEFIHNSIIDVQI